MTIQQQQPRWESEQALVQAAVEGDHAALRKLLQQVLPRLKRTATFLSVDESEREEIIQNALIEMVKSIGAYRGDCSLNYWVDRVTVFTATKQIDKTVRRRRIQEKTWFPPVELRSVEEEVDLDRMRNRLCDHLETLKSHERVPLVLHYLHGYKVEEIAALTNVKLNTIRGRLRSALKKIRKRVVADPVLSSWVKGGTL